MNAFKKGFTEILALFSLLAFVFIPLTFNGKDFQFRITLFLFQKPVELIQEQLFANGIRNIDFSSDTIGLNLLLLLLFLLAMVVVVGLKLLKIKTSVLVRLFYACSPYYIGLVLLKYGIDKVLLQQFSQPEANILYTPFGRLDKDILLWSTLGTSKFYNVAIGFVEVFVALLLFFRSTRLVGFYMSLALLLNICIINFGFDISVKTFSLFLLLVITINILPSLKQVYAFFVRQQFVQLKSDQEALKLPYHRFVKPVLLLCIGWYILSPIAWAFNNNTQLSPFNGAYEVINKTGEKNRFKKVFFHKNDYIIFQDENDAMIDYHYQLDTVSKSLVLQDYHNNQVNVGYSTDEKAHLILRFKDNAQELVLNPINWQALPALKDGIHYTIDEIK